MANHTKEKHQDVREYFESLRSQKEKFYDGKAFLMVTKYEHRYCLHKTAKKFYLSWRTVENIINGWGTTNKETFIDPLQTSIPLD